MQNMMPAETETGVEYRRTEEASTKTNSLRNELILAAIFGSALSIRLWFNFAADHANCAGCCDASEYVRNAAALSGMLALPQEFWHKFFASAFGSASPADLESVRAAMSGLKEVYQAGPVFPIFLTLSFSAAGFLFTGNPLGAPVLVQSVLSAIACCLIADFTSKAWTRTVGYTAGFIAAVYPGFIINSGRLYTESFATFLVCVLLALVVQGFFSSKNVIPRAIAIGLLSACLQLTRSILVVSSICMIPILYAQQRSAGWKSGVAALLLGFACVVVPWVSFQHVAFDKGGIVVDRVGNYNLFIGSNTQTQGWLTFPYPDGAGIEKKSLPSLLAESFKTSPSRFVRLMLDKPARLFQMPWNDFRTGIGAFDVGAQSLLHQFLLLFAGLGLVLALFTAPSKASPTQGQLYSRLLLLGFAAIHLVYALFITVPRYAITAMPCVIAFSAAGIVALVVLLANPKTRRVSVALSIVTLALWGALHNSLVQPLMDSGILSNAIFALGVQSAIKLCLLSIWFVILWAALRDTSGYRRIARVAAIGFFLMAIPFVVLPSRAAGRWYEWQKPFGDKPVTQTLSVPAHLGNQQTYLMIDADGANSLASADVTVNGKKLTGPIIPGLAVAQDYSILQHVANGKVNWEAENIFNFMTKPADLSNAELRQWFLIPVPSQVAAAAATGPLTVTVSNPTGQNAGTIYGSYNHGRQLSIPSASIYSWEKAFYGVENDRGVTDPRLDESVAAPSTVALVEPNIRLLVPARAQSPESAQSASVSLLKRVPLKPFELSAQSMSKPFTIFTMPAHSQNDLWIVRTTGSIKSNNGIARPTMILRADCKAKSATPTGLEAGAPLSPGAPKQANCYESPWTPNFIPTSKDWQHFEISAPIAPGQLPGGIKQLQGEFVFDVPKWKTAHLLPTDAVQLKDLRIDIIKLPGNPLARGFSIQ
ncbi:MAG: hypothetical protein HYX67_09820 [Candidatus Melainabacteria bacterium]|nr:hypothetical protein [Candidatus Melainabacteria bacterium]